MNFVNNRNGCMATDEVAEPLGISAQRLHQFLEGVGVIKRRRHKWFLKTPYRGMGLEVRKKNKYKSKTDGYKYNSHLYWSYKGERYIQDLWKQEQLHATARVTVTQPELPLFWNNTPIPV